VAVLVRDALTRLAEEQGGPPRRLSPGLMELLQQYSWPGNVRELINLLERLVFTVDGPEIGIGDLPPALARRLLGEPGPVALKAEAVVAPGSRLDSKLAEAEYAALVRALQQARGSKARAARLLGIHRTTLYDKLKRYGLGDL